MIVSYYIPGPSQRGSQRKRRGKKNAKRQNPPWNKEDVRVDDGGNKFYRCEACGKVLKPWEGIVVEDLDTESDDRFGKYSYSTWKAFHLDHAPAEVAEEATAALASYHTLTLKESAGNPGLAEFRLPKNPWNKDERGSFSKPLLDRLNRTVERYGGEIGHAEKKKKRDKETKQVNTYYIHHPYTIPIGQIDAFIQDISKPDEEGSLAVVMPPEIREKLDEIATSMPGQTRDITQQLGNMQSFFTARKEPLQPWQLDGARFLAEKCNALLADEQGLGKTIEAAVALDVTSPVIIVCPTVVMINWYRELVKWRPDRDPSKIFIHNPTGKKIAIDHAEDGSPIYIDQEKGPLGQVTKKWHWPKEGETFITAYSRLMKDPVKSEIKKRGLVTPHTILIADEAQKVKGKFKTARASGEADDEQDEEGSELADDPTASMVGGVKVAGTKSSYRFQVISDMVRYKGGCVWILTGTPLSNEGDELWRIFSRGGMEHDVFGDWGNFVRWMSPEQGKRGRGGKAAKYDWKETHPNTHALVPALRKKMLRREKIDQLDIPPKQYVTIDVEISPDDLQRVDEIGITEEDFQAIQGRGGGGGISDAMLEKIAERQQEFDEDDIALFAESQGGGVAFAKIAKARAILARAKIPALNRFISEQFEAKNEPVVVFSSHNAPLEALVMDAQIRARQRGEKQAKKWGIILGSTSMAQRQRAVDAFQAGQLDGLAVSIRAGGAGLTLTKSANSVFVDRDWNPANNQQAEDRIHRMGQKRQAIITFIRANHHIDYRLWEVLARKEGMIHAVISASTIRRGEDIPGLSKIDRQLYEKALKEEFKLFSGKFKAGKKGSKAAKRRFKHLSLKQLQRIDEQASDEAELEAMATPSIPTLPTIDIPYGITTSDHKYQSGKRGAPQPYTPCIVCKVPRNQHDLSYSGPKVVPTTKPSAKPSPRAFVKPPKSVAPQFIDVPQQLTDHKFEKIEGGRGRAAQDAKCKICKVERRFHGEPGEMSIALPAKAPKQEVSSKKSGGKSGRVTVQHKGDDILLATGFDHYPKREGPGRRWPTTVCEKCGHTWEEHLANNPYDPNGGLICPVDPYFPTILGYWH